jgi:hypothetical protein
MVFVPAGIVLNLNQALMVKGFAARVVLVKFKADAVIHVAFPVSPARFVPAVIEPEGLPDGLPSLEVKFPFNGYHSFNPLRTMRT